MSISRTFLSHTIADHETSTQSSSAEESHLHSPRVIQPLAMFLYPHHISTSTELNLTPNIWGPHLPNLHQCPYIKQLSHTIADHETSTQSSSAEESHLHSPRVIQPLAMFLYPHHISTSTELNLTYQHRLTLLLLLSLKSFHSNQIDHNLQNTTPQGNKTTHWELAQLSW